MKVSVVLVHYHTPELAARAVAALRGEGGSGLAVSDLEILIVDNGSDAEGRRRLASLDAHLLEPGENLGYAGGLNLGVAESSGDLLLLANPDVELLPGALDRLVATLAESADAAGAAVAGPRFLWDPEGRFLLPPAERRDRWSELATALAARGPAWAARARRRWRRHAHRHWTATRPHPSPWLSGALLATTRATWERVGPFDAGFRLYFEETDWLLRAARRGVPLVHEPRARALHHYNRSAAAEPRATAWFADSEQRFSRRWYGPAFRAVRRWVAPPEDRLDFPPPTDRCLPTGGAPPVLDLEALVPTPGVGNLWLELSPLARGFPAAAERLDGSPPRWSLPEALWRHMDAGRWCLTLVDDGGRELLRTGLEVPPPEARG